MSAPHPGAASAPPGTFSSLRIRNFRYLWLGQISHAGALWMEQIARPFLILEITDGSATHLGGVSAVRMLPQLLFGLWAGVVSDWFDRRRILLAVKAIVFALNVAFAAILVAGLLQLWLVYAYAFLRGSMMAFDQPARQSLIPATVPPERLTNAVALMSATQNTMRIAGAALGGVAYGVIGAEGTFVAIAVIYVGAVVYTYLLDVPTHERPGEADLYALSRGLVEGLRFAFNHTAIRGVLGLSLVYFTFGVSYMQVFLPLFAEGVLEIGSTGFGVMSALSGAGALAMAILIAARPPTRLGALLPGIVVAFGVALVAFSASTYLPRPAGLWLPLLLVMLAGAMQTSFFSLGRVLMLQEAPDPLRGRVLSLLSLDRALMTAGAAGAGFLAAWRGVQEAQILYGSLCIAGGLGVLLLATSFRRATTTAVGSLP